jgi:multidrug efflux pump subunit AcrA (membrane-fusion protein)
VKCKALKRKLRAEPLALAGFSPPSKGSTNVQAPDFVPLGSPQPSRVATSQSHLPPRRGPSGTVAVEHRAEGETVSLTGHVRAKDQANLAFRLDGRMIERPVNVGDVVTRQAKSSLSSIRRSSKARCTRRKATGALR